MITFKNIKEEKEYRELANAFQIKEDLLIQKEDGYIKVNDTSVKLPNLDIYEKKKITHALYQAFYQRYQKNLAWGSLVGVNPLKLIDRVGDEETLLSFYFIQKDKIALAKKILSFQKEYKESIQEDFSLYINIPFCPSKCIYCSYPTYPQDESLMDQYVLALCREIEVSSQFYSNPPTAIYIGGGTPSALGQKRLEKILRTIHKYFQKPRECTVEIGRADTIDKDLLLMLKKNGVDRISINPQTMQDDTLKLIQRKGSFEEILKAFHLAKEIGFEDINMDLIMGLPSEKPEDFAASLEKIAQLSPSSLSIHCLALKKGSQLFEENWNPKVSGAFEGVRDQFTEEHNYYPYYLYRQKHMVLASENIGYVKKGFFGLYNIAMMEDLQDILALGLAASSKKIGKRIKRHMNYRRLKDYLENLDQDIQEKRLLFQADEIA